jgi:hypothetical protein
MSETDHVKEEKHFVLSLILHKDGAERFTDLGKLNFPMVVQF